nr:tubulin--tyrosine ligase-like protein 12 [Ipomoea batatas]GMC90484.1 tubulin--tyrosine ligase-like protein 12 [Ipomoea batatas]
MEEARRRHRGVDGGVVYNGSAFAVNNGSSFQDLDGCMEDAILQGCSSLEIYNS